jgi:hypothetical protein
MGERMIKLVLSAGLALGLCSLTSLAAADDLRVEQLVEDIQTHGEDPLGFVLTELEQHALLIFDDGLHSAVEPWTFYETLVQHPDFAVMARHVFIEILNVNDQPGMDVYFNTYPEDPSLLNPVLQNSTINGWRYQTYPDLFRVIHAVNAGLAEDQRIKVHLVSTPGYWNSIETPADYANYIGPSQLARDNFMYENIKEILNGLDGSERGIFLTNTRHAYTGLRDENGEFFWNTATFFRQWHGDSTLSIRFNAPFLNVESTRDPSDSPASGQGLERFNYSWARAANGDWDRAFARTGNNPVALRFEDTHFGDAPYVGNRVHRAFPGQTMSDVNDALIHLSAIDDWQKSADYVPMLTPEFHAELLSRYQRTQTDAQIERRLQRAGVETLEAYVGLVLEPSPQSPLPQAGALPPLE